MGKQDDIKRQHHTPEQIVRKLREADRLLGEGSSSGERGEYATSYSTLKYQTPDKFTLNWYNNNLGLRKISAH
jgi:hypothetical protein